MGADEQTLIVSATQQTVSELDTPAAVSVVNGDDMRHAAPRINLSESLGSVRACKFRTARTTPGICSCRCVGLVPAPPSGCAVFECMWTGSRRPCQTAVARPLTLISSVESVEVLRGPFSALYGNASGGVININTQTGQQPPTIEASSYYGSYGTGATG